MTVAQHKIITYMTDHNIDQQTLSRKLGYCDHYVNKLLCGQKPYLANMQIIEVFLGIENEWHKGFRDKLFSQHETISDAIFSFYLKYGYRLNNGLMTAYTRGKMRPNNVNKWRDVCEFFGIKNDWVTLI